MPTPDKVEELYNALKADGAVQNSLDYFRGYMSSASNRKKLYDALKADGAVTSNTFEEFDQKLGYPYNTRDMNEAAGVDEASNRAQQAQQPTQRNMGTPGYVPNRFGIPTQQGMGPVADAAPHPMTPAQPLSFQERVQKSVGMAHNVGKAKADFSQRMSAIEQGNKPFSSGKAQQYDPTTGETKDVYYTTTGQAVSTPMERDIANIDNSPQGRIGKELEDAYAERDRLEQELSSRSDEVKADGTSTVAKIGAGTLLGLTPAGVLAPELAKQIDKRIDPQWAMLNAAKRANDKRIAILERDRDRDGFFRTVGKTLFDIDTWDFGANEIVDAVTLSAAADKKLTGKAGEAQEALMRNTYLKQIAEQRSEDDTFMQRAGDITANAIPFVLEFILTGGGYAAIGAAGRRLGAKAAAKIGAKGFAAWTMKNTGTLAGNMLSGLLMANTTGLGRTAADIMGRHQGVLTQDENGDYVFRDGKSWGRSVYEGEMAQAIEYFTEHLGASVFDKALGKWVYPTAGKLLTKGLDKLGASKVSEMFSRMSSSQWAAILNKGGIQDYPSEVLEEAASIVLNSLFVGDNQFSDLWDRKTLADILGGMALSIGFMQAPGVARGAYNTAQYYRFKHNTDKSDQEAAKVMGEQWEGMRDLIDNTPNEGMQDVIEHILDSPLPDDFKATSVTYAYNLMKLRGYNLRTAANAKDRMADTDENGEPRAMSEEETAVNEAFANGYEADEQQRSDISIEREDNPNDPQAQAAWQGVEDRIRQDAADRADQRRAEGEKMAYKGKGDMQGAIRPLTINEESSERDPETGERKKKTVYLVNGNIAIEPNGNGLSREGTDKTIYVYDPETGDTHELDPFGGAGVLSVGDVVSMEDYLADNEQQSQAEVQQEIDNATGKVNVQPNTPFVTPEGRQGIVKSVEGDNVIVQFADGEMEEASIPLADMQQYADALRRQEYEARHPKQGSTEQPQQPNTATEGQAPTATAETPTEGGNAAEDTRTPAQRTYDDMTAKYGEKASHKVDVTMKDRKATLDSKKKALDKAQADYDDAPIGKEDKAEAALAKAQEEYNNALADYNAWDEVRKLRDQALLVQAEQEEQQRKAELERKRAAETEAQRKQREAYEAEQARRKAEAEAAEKRRQEENERLRQQEAEAAANPRPTEEPAPIEGTKGQQSQLAIARQELADDPGALAMLEDMEPTSLEEVAALLLTSGKGQVKLLREDFMAQTGYSSEDVKRYPFIFAGKEKGGITLAQFGEKVIEEARDYNIPLDDNDAMVGVNAVLNMLSSVGRQSDINDYVAMNRIRMAYDYHNAALAEARATMLEAYGMTDGEYESYMSWLEDAAEQRQNTLTDEQALELINQAIQQDNERQAETNAGNSEQQSTETTERTESAETDTGTNGERGNGETDAGTAEVSTYKTQTLAEIESFHKRTSRGKRTELDLNKYDEENLRMPLLLDGKESNISISAVLPTDINQPIIYRANYTFGDFEQMGEYIDKWNKTHKTPNTKAREDADIPECYFTNVDAAVAFADWVKKQETTPTEQTEGTAEGETEQYISGYKPSKKVAEFEKESNRLAKQLSELEEQRDRLSEQREAKRKEIKGLRGKKREEANAEITSLGESIARLNEEIDRAEDESNSANYVYYDARDAELYAHLGKLSKEKLEALAKQLEERLGKGTDALFDNDEYSAIINELDEKSFEEPAVETAQQPKAETWEEHVNKAMEAYDKEYAAIEKSDGERMRKEAAGYSDERLLNTYIRNAGISQIFGKGREGMRKFIGEEKNFKAEKLDEVKENNLEAAPDAARQSFVQDVLRAELDRRGIEYKEDYTFAETSEAEAWYKKNVGEKSERGSEKTEKYRDGESIKDYTQRNGDYPTTREQYMKQKYGERYSDMANIMSGINAENAREKGRQIGALLETDGNGLDEAQALLSVFKADAPSTMPFFDGVVEGKPKESGKGEKVKNEAAPKQKIDDVGEKIGGARKDLAQKMGAKINLDADTFPKMFPKFDLKKAVEQGLDPKLASAVYILRIEAQQSYKSRLKHYSKENALSAAKFWAAYAKQFLENGNTSTEFKDSRWTFTEYGKKHIEYNLALYEKVYEKFGNTLFDLDFSGYTIRPVEKNKWNHYYRRNEQGKEEEYQPAYEAVAGYSSKYYTDGELDKAIDELVNRMAESVSYKESHPYKLSHYYTPGVANSHYIGVKLGGKVVALTEKMGDKEASKYLKEHEAELQEKAKRLDEERKQSKQGGTNTKWKPELGLGGGRARVGNDYRNGKDVSAEDFRETFGFRGVEFGNYVTQAERQRFINEAYDAMMDLAALLNVSPRALSLGGRLGFAIGARGGGSAMAHYEPDLNVINLTKSKGAGSLAHEWWHALDYYFNSMGDYRKTPATANKRAEDFNPGHRAEMANAFVSLMEKINGSDYRKRSVALDAALNKDYYTNPTELGARAFQDYVQRRLTDRGQVNDFLSSFTPEEQWNGKAETYPYPTGKDADVIDERFDSLFGTMLEREDEQGNVMLYERVDGKAAKVSARERKLRDAVVDLLRKAGIDVVTESEEGQRVLDMANGRERQHRVYHGSGADFEAFDHSHMGEGEGAQAFGWGTYVTEVEGIGRTYAEAMGNKRTYKGKVVESDPYSDNAADRALFYMEQERGRNNAIKFIKQLAKEEDDETTKNEYFETINVLRDEANWKESGRFIYTVEIPEDNGSNYLDWTKTIPKSDRRRIADAVRGLAGEPAQSVKYANYTGGWGQLADMIERNQWAFQEVRDRLLEAFGGRIADDKKVSELMHSAGFVGIKYPADYYNGGRADNAKNYVIFNEGDLQITDKVKFFRTESGEAYGFTKGGKIYLDPRIATAETPIHEYTHLWAAALRQANPKAWEQLKSELEKDKDLMAYVQRLYPELKGDELMDEVFAHFSGRRGAERLRAEQERMEGETRSIVGKAKVIAMFERLRDAMKRFWNMARDLFAGKSKGVENENAEDFADMVLGDLVSGFNPTENKKGEQSSHINPRSSVPNVRGGWNERKIKDYLKHNSTRSGVFTAARAISEFDNVDELKEHMFYHGTVYGSDRLKPSITMSEREAERYGGGGYGERFWGISLTKSKKVASAFSGSSSFVRIYPVILLKDAKVIERHDFEDAADVEEHIVELWNEGVDAVWIGEGKQGKGEQELCVLNPRAVVNIGTPDFYKVYQLGTKENPLRIADDAAIEKMYKTAKEYVSFPAPRKPFKPLTPDRYDYKDGEVVRISDEEYAQRVAEYEDALEKYTNDIEEYNNSEALRMYENIREKAKRDIRYQKADSDVRFRGEEEPVFYSNAMRAVENIKQERATPEQWVKMIEKQGGLKAGEDKWLGLSEWLKGSDAKTLTKGEVMDYIRANEIQIEEVEYAGKAHTYNETRSKFIEKAKEYIEENGINEFAENYGEEAAELFNPRFDYFGNEDWSDIEVTDEDALKEYLYNHYEISDEETSAPNPINETRLQYTTEGLDNKREIVLTVPTIEPWNEYDEVHFGEAGGGRAVAWVRFGETTDADGKRVLVIDEIQSNRHQEGRERGYNTEYKFAIKELEENLRLQKEAISNADFNLLKGFGVTEKLIEEQDEYVKSVLELKFPQEYKDRLKEAYARLKEWHELVRKESVIREKIRKNEINKDAVPDAPFDKNWHEVALKRMLRFAAENGYDKVAWTKGEQQAERYDLGGLIDHIDIYPHVDNITGERVEGEYEVFPVDKRGNTMMAMTEHPFSGNLTADEVLQYYGKDLGTRMMQAADKAGNDEKSTIEGEGLRIGGEGMKGFYDQILPRFMDKYGKKWGVKTGEVELPNIGDNGLTMWSVDVTDDMRESVMRGQPLFRKSTELFEQYPTWLSGQTTSTGQHTTQITSTVKTYQRIGDWMQSQGMEGAKVLDASSGLGAGTQALRDMGFDVEDVEPYPSENREAPTYTRYEDVNGKYDVVISNAVLNVIPDDWRADVLRSMADKVKEGGKLIINVRDAKSIESQKQKIELDSPSEILVTDSKGNIRAYQKGFTKSELKAYVESELGEGWQVEIANEGNSGVKSGTAVIVTRGEGAEVPNYRKPADMMREGGEEAYAGDWYDRNSVERIGEFAGYSPKQIAKMNARQEESARNKFRDAAEKLHLSDNITFADTIYDVPGLTDKQRREWRRKKGWYSPRTGKIVIILVNHKSMDDVMKSILHEGVAHHGLRQMFGEHFNTFLDNVYRVASPEIRDRINTMAKKHGWDFREATEEYLAMLAEDTDFERPENQSWWKQVKEWFIDMLHKIGFKLHDAYDTITDNELRYILWRSYQNLVNPGRYNSVVEEAKDIAKQYDLKVGEFGTNTTKTSWNFGINNQKARERFVEMLDNSGVKYSHHYSSKYGSDYYTFSIRDRNGEIGDFRIRISDHAKPAQWGTSYIEGDNDFRSYEDAYRYLATQFDLSDKREAIERKREELMQQVEEVQRNGETLYKMRDGNSLFSSPDAAVNNRMETEVIPTMTGQLVDDIYADGETHKRDAEYMEAVNNGDMEKAQRMVNEAAKRAMPDTKVVDENGNPLVVYHGTPNAYFFGNVYTGAKPFYVFDKNKKGSNTEAQDAKSGFFFTPDYRFAAYFRTRKEYDPITRITKESGYSSSKTYEVYLNMKNPLDLRKLSNEDAIIVHSLLNGYGYDVEEVKMMSRTKNGSKELQMALSREIDNVKAKGYDGIINFVQDDKKKKNVEYIAFESSQIKSADPVTYDDNGNVIPLSQRFSDSDDIRFRDGEDEETGAPKPQARGAYERMVSSAASQWKEAMQDSMLSLKKLYQAVSQAYKGSTKGVYRIEDEKGYENAYLAENRMHSMSEAQIHAYQQDYMKPLQRAIHALTDGKREAYETLTDYMMAKHGLERNEVMAKRDAKKAWEEQNKSEIGNPNYTAAKNAAFANIDAGVDDLYLEYRKQDYAGLTALTGIEDVEEAEKEAQRMVDEYEQQHDTTDLWKATNRATRRSLFKMLESGILSPERHADIRDMYQYYIPLQGFDSDVAEDVYAYMGSDGTRLYGTTIRAAKGRKSKADDPIATIAMNGEAAIRRGNRNLMKQHFLRFVQSHPSDLVSINDVWLRKNANGEWEQYFDADLKETDTPEEVARKVRDFNERMEQEAAANPDLYKRSRDLPNVPFRVLNVRDMEQHQVMVQVDGKNYLLTINGNPRAAQALNGLTNPDVFTEGAFGSIMNATQSVVRTLSQFYTTRNPNFVLSNFLRDAVYTNSMVLAKESPNYALNFHKNFLLLPNERMGVLFASWENGKLREKIANDTASKMEKMFYDFMMNGGETGWTSLRDIEKHKRDLQKALKREGNIAASSLKKLGDFFDITNRMIENHARFTAYVTSIEMGRSVERAVWDAKEISVNFNKKGAGDKFLKAKNQTFVGKVGAFVSGLGRGNYAFWNASLQGLNNIARIGRRNPAKFMAVATTLMGLGVAIPLLNALLGGDDDDDKNAYWNLPEYVRRSNICFRFTKDMPWITIPLPIEFRAIYGLGELGSGVALGKEYYSKGELTKQVAAQFSQVLPLDFMEGGGGWHCLYPTYIKPVIEAYSNQSWTGLPIYRKNTYGQYDVAPEWQRAYSNTNNQIMVATKWLNEATGGDEVQGGNIDFNPARIEYMLRGYLGGYFTVADQVIKMGETATGNREFEWRNMMLANRVVKEGDERTEARKLTNEYFNLKDEYDKTDKSLKAYKKKQDDGTLSVVGQAHYIALMNDSEEYGRYLVFGTYKPLFDAYYKQIKEANAAGDSEEAKRLERGQNELRREMVNIIHDMDNGGTFDRKKVATGINENLKKMQNDKLWDAQDKAINKSIEADNALNPTDNVEE